MSRYQGLQALDVGSSDFFNAGTLTSDVTVSFSNVPTEARWSYSFVGDLVSTYDIDNASYDDVTLNVSAQDSSTASLFLKPDGTKMYIMGRGSERVYQYSLSTPWDLSTASYDGSSFFYNQTGDFPIGLFFKDDGTQMYISELQSDTLYQYSLSTPWEIGSSVSLVASFGYIGQANNMNGVFIKSDGTKLYMGSAVTNRIYQYSLSTPWQINSMSYDNISFDASGQATSLQGLFFKPDGTKMYVAGGGTDTVYQYSLSTAWDLSTASYDSVSFDASGQLGILLSVFLKPGGTKMYLLDSDAVYQYSTGSYGTITLPASVQNSPSETFTTERVTYTFFTDDGGTNVHLISEEIE